MELGAAPREFSGCGVLSRSLLLSGTLLTVASRGVSVRGESMGETLTVYHVLVRPCPYVT